MSSFSFWLCWNEIKTRSATAVERNKNTAKHTLFFSHNFLRKQQFNYSVNNEKKSVLKFAPREFYATARNQIMEKRWLNVRLVISFLPVFAFTYEVRLNVIFYLFFFESRIDFLILFHSLMKFRLETHRNVCKNEIIDHCWNYIINQRLFLVRSRSIRNSQSKHINNVLFFLLLRISSLRKINWYVGQSGTLNTFRLNHINRNYKTIKIKLKHAHNTHFC